MVAAHPCLTTVLRGFRVAAWWAGFNAVNILQTIHRCASYPRPSSPMAMKTKSFDAVAASRRWRIAAGKRLAAMMSEERREHLHRTTQTFFFREAVAHYSRADAPLNSAFIATT